jgi:glycosyltransferase involved in cell wall biosynthesis
MRVIHYSADGASEWNSGNFRGRIFHNAFLKAGVHSALVNIEAWMKDANRADVAQADLVVIERVLVEESVEHCRYWHSLGKPVVIDIDDSYHRLQSFEESGNQAARFWKEGLVDVSLGGMKFEKRLDVTPLEQFRRGLQYCAGLTMPSRFLAEEWAPYAPTYYVPNYLDPDRYLPHKAKLPHHPKEIVIGWGGSMSHKISFEKSGVAEGLRILFRKNPHVKFLLAGDNRILDILKLPRERVIYQPYVSYQEWPRVLARMDIVVAPLHGEYDWSRSCIKTFEAASLGIPYVATGCRTYEDWQANNVGWFVNDGPENEIGKRAELWAERLIDMCDNYPRYKQEIDAALPYAQTWWVDNRVNDVIATYQTIIDRFHGVT